MSVQEWNGAFKKSPYSKKSGAFMSVSVFSYTPVAILHHEIIYFKKVGYVHKIDKILNIVE